MIVAADAALGDGACAVPGSLMRRPLASVGQLPSPVSAWRTTFSEQQRALAARRRDGDPEQRRASSRRRAAPASSTSMPISSSEAIEAAACEIAQPWPWKRRSAMRPSATAICTPSSSPHSGLTSCASWSWWLELAEVARTLVVLEDEVAVEVVHQRAKISCASRIASTSASTSAAHVVGAEARARGRGDAEAAPSAAARSGGSRARRRCGGRAARRRRGGGCPSTANEIDAAAVVGARAARTRVTPSIAAQPLERVRGQRALVGAHVAPCRAPSR